MRGLVILIGLLATTVRGEVNTHIPPTPDSATSPTFSSRDYDILIGPAVKVPVRMPTLLQIACRASSRVSACTYFAEERLTCRCLKDGEQWQLQATVNFVPVMYLSNPRLESHEQLHVDDVAAMLRDHLEALVQLRFSSEQHCTLQADAQTGGFTALMNAFRRDSNRRLR